jgi:hypothetical protein
MGFLQVLDTVFELATVLWELLSHLVDAAWHIKTDYWSEDYNVTNLEFMRWHVIDSNFGELFNRYSRRPFGIA